MVIAIFRKIARHNRRSWEQVKGYWQCKRKETLGTNTPGKGIKEGLFEMILSSDRVAEQERVENFAQEVVGAFESALHSDLGLAILREVMDANSLGGKERALVKLRATAFTTAAQVVFKERGYTSSRIPCSCGGRKKHVENDEKGYVTLVGEMRIKRARYRCLKCGDIERPLDEKWDLPSGHFSDGVQRLASIMSAWLPFASLEF